MKRKIVSGLVLTTLLVCTLTLVSNVELLKASGTIYIRADGSIEGTDKIERDGNLYTFTDNINDEIVVERDNIVIDGADYTVEGTGSGVGIYLSASNVTIKNMKITAFDRGIYIDTSSNNSIFGNDITNNDIRGIELEGATYNTIERNNITAGGFDGVTFYNSSYNTLYRNNITNNTWGVYLDLGASYNNISRNSIAYNREYGVGLGIASDNNILENNITNNAVAGVWFAGTPPNNKLYHNNFIDNTQQVYIETPSCVSLWDCGYPSGGNYWSDYTGSDDFWGVNQDLKGCDMIGDTSYVIDEENSDNYTLMMPWRESRPPITEFPDLNGDGKVNIIDIALVAKHFGEEYEDP